MRISEKAFLEPMFRSLEENGIIYAVLRNAETLPETTGGSDIDMQIATGKMSDVTLCLEEVASQCGGRIMARIDSPHFRQLQFCGCMNGKWWGCCLDLFEGVFCQSVLPIAGDTLLGKRIRSHQGVWMLDDERGAYLGFVKELLTNGVYSRRYEEGAKRAVAAGKDDFLFDESLREFIKKTLLGESCSANVFRRTWLLAMAIRHPVFFWCNWFGFMFSRFKRVFRPAGRMIAIMGTDGAGKTTVIEGIIPVLNLMNHGNTIVHHLKPDLLPPLGRLRGVKHEPGHVCTNPHGSKPSGVLGSIVRSLYLMCDYILGYWLKIRPRLAKIPAPIWISDRYAYDMLIDPRRFRIAMPERLMKIFVFFSPRPDLTVCLGGAPGQIYARKPETSLDEVERQVAALKHFCCNYSRTVWVDTTTSIERSVDVVLNSIMTTMIERGIK